MTLQSIVLILVTSLLMASGNLLLKWSVKKVDFLMDPPEALVRTVSYLIREPTFVTGIVFYSIATVLWLFILTQQSISLSYPIFVTFAFLFVTLGATMVFHEPLTLHRLFGIALMVAGITYVSLK